MRGFVKLMREAALDLLENKPNAYLLLSQIALRARWSEEASSIYRLGINQSLIGDHEKIGLTNSEYKTAKKILSTAGYADFHPTPGKGTIATLLTPTVFDINTDHEMTHESLPKTSMENDSPRPINNHDKTSAQPPKHQPLTGQQPLTKKEEEEKETTTSKGCVIYKCLEKETRLSDKEKAVLMCLGIPEERIKLGLEYCRTKTVIKSLLGYVIWHCRQESPPEANNSYQTTVERKAWDYNTFLQENGYLALADKNMRSIPQGHMHIPMPNGPISITLNTTVEGFEKDLAECNQLMFNRQVTFTQPNIT